MKSITKRPSMNGRFVLAFAFILLFFSIVATQPAQAVSSDVVISQVYGGGSNTGAPYTNDFVELFNRSATTVSLSGWSVQYASATGTGNFGVNPIVTLSGSLAPGQYYLVQLAGGSIGAALPTPDATGTANLSGASGKVVLVNTTTGLACNGGSTPCSSAQLAQIVDLVGYGTANFFEGSGAAPTASNTTAVFRINNGCTDTDNNTADFVTGAPMPRNTASPSGSCALPTNPTGIGAATPDAVAPGAGTLLTVTVTPGANPASTGLTVIADLTGIGGTADQPLLDNGINGDAVAGDNIFSYQVTVDGSVSPGAKSLPVSIVDDQSRSSSASIELTVQTPVVLGADIVISQVYGGGGNSGATYTHDFIELYNRSASAVNISGWSVQYASAAGTSWAVTALSGTLAPGQYYLIQQAQGAGGTTSLPTPDASGSIAMSATAGKIALVNTAAALTGSCPTGAAIVDFVGFGATANCFEGSGPTPAPSNTTAVIRLGSGAVDTDNNAADFVAGAPNPRNSGFGIDAAPQVAGTSPANGAAEAPVNTNLTITFSEPVNVTGNWFTIDCASGSYTAVVSGGPGTFVLDPTSDLAYGDSCTVTVLASQVTDIDENDPPDNMNADYSFSFSTVGADVCELAYTPIYEIQGSGLTTQLANQTVTTLGVVVGDYEGPSPTLRGFYMQDLTGDGDLATSDGIFVFNFDNNNVNLGDIVRVTGTAAEFQNQTQISSVSSIANCGAGSVTPVDITFPVPSTTYLEQFEGMLVRLPQTMYVTEHFQLGRFGQVLLSANGRLQQPTNIVSPGAPALALQAANNLNKIILDDAQQNQNPDPIVFGRGGLPLSASNTLRGGDTATNIVGVLTYTWAGNAASGNAYRIRPLNALNGYVNFEAVNLRPTEAPDVGGALKVVGMNLLNFFNTFNDGNAATPGCFPGGGDSDCRGASNATEFERQWRKTVAAILAMNPDVLGVNELENDGYGPDSSIQFLVDQLNAATAPGTYAFIAVDANTGQVNVMGTDAIRVALLYKPGVVTPVGQTAPLNSAAFVNGGDGAPRNRVSLAQAFEQNANGAVFIVNVNHLKSKGSACTVPDAGDGQGNCNQVRLNAVNELMTWLATDPTGTGDPDILLVGDYNSYAMEDPIIALENGGFSHLIKTFLGPDAYSYVFDGQWGSLDHALATASLTSQVTGVADYHINADEPSVLDYLEDFKSPGQLISLYAPDQFRVSDHDPILIGLDLNVPPTVDAGGPYTVVEDGTVSVTAVGFDPEGGALTYEWDLDNDGVFETAGQSVLFSAAMLSAPGSYPITVRVTDIGGLTATDQALVFVVYNFAGFFHPVQNLPTINIATAGSAVPMKFSLNGDKGLNIFAAGSPTSVRIACDSSNPENDVEQTLSPGGSALSYDPAADRYTYVWKTQRTWRNTCRQFTLQLDDGSVHLANFRFK